MQVSDLQAEAMYKRGFAFSFSLADKPSEATVWTSFTKEHLIIDAPDDLAEDLEHLDPDYEDQDRWLLAGISCRPGEWPVGTRGASGLPWADNQFILKWWTPAHDAVLLDAISRDRWFWSVPLNELIAVTPTGELEEFKHADPRCKTWAWKTVIGYFARARADAQGWAPAFSRR